MSLFYYVCFFSFSLGSLIYCHVQFVACTFVTCFNKDQSINQSIKWALDGEDSIEERRMPRSKKDDNYNDTKH